MSTTKRRAKYLLAFVAAAVLALAMAVPAFAATITVTQNNSEGTAGAETYNLYKIFDVTKTADQASYETTTGGAGTETGFSYTISTSNPWFNVLGTASGDTWTAATGQSWVTLTKSAANPAVYNVTYDSEKNTEAEAKKFADWLYKNKGSIAANTTITSSSGSATTTTAVDDGYWLIDSSLGTNLILATSNVDIQTKNQYPTTEKTVAKTNYNVGDFVEYTIKVNLPATVDYTKPVIVHDTMDNVLSLVTATTGANAWSAKVGETNFTSNVTLSTGKTNNHDGSTHAIGASQVGYDFTLDISSLAPAANETATAKVVEITYYAELTSAAAADTGYVNKEFVEYSEYTTPEDDTEIKTFDFDLKKTFDGKVNANLEATFILTTNATDETTAIQFIKDNTGYVKVDSDDTGGNTTLTVKGDANGIKVRGLAAGTYYLIEKTTADGYNLLTTPITVSISDQGVATLGNTSNLFSATDSVITVNNATGAVLPSTGGIGTTILYIIGGILVLGAVVFLITKRRMAKVNIESDDTI